MGWRHLNQAHPNKRYWKQTLVIFLCTEIIVLIAFTLNKSDKYDYTYKGKNYSVIVEKGKEPYWSEEEDMPLHYLKVEIIKDENYNGFDTMLFLKWHGFLFFIILPLSILARYGNRLLYGEDGDKPGDW